MNTPDRQSVVVIGIGNPLRRDDGIGPVALDALRQLSLDSCDIVELDGETTRVIDEWRDRAMAIVVDAVCTGDQAGALHDLTLDDFDNIRIVPRATSSHFAGLAEALALGRALDRLPAKLRVLGIEPGDLDYGVGLSPPVAATMGTLVHRLRHAVIDATAAVTP